MQNQITNRKFGITSDGDDVIEYTLINKNGLELKVINYGCTITSLRIPDRNGNLEDIVLGFDHLDRYLHSNHYIGCVIGRYANRIAHGMFTLDGKEYAIAKNNPPHHLHGGVRGFNRVVWIATAFQNENGVGIRFNHFSPDGDEGYPGNLNLEVLYFLAHDNTLTFEYAATTDRLTIINLTQHSYFNLTGGKENILNHQLMLNADYFLPVDDTMIPTGEMRSVAGTPFDFRKPKQIGLDINLEDLQLSIAHGYDHSFVVAPSREDINLAAILHDPVSGRVMKIFTSEPGIQFYTANFLESRILGKNNIRYGPQSGLCLETQHFPDSPNQPGFPTVILNKGKTYFSKTLIQFSVL